MSDGQYSSPIDLQLPLVPNVQDPELFEEFTRVYNAIRKIQLGASFSSIASGLIATGTNQTTALVLGAAINVIVTTPAGSGVIVPEIGAGSNVVIKNFGANALNIYPVSGGQIDSLATNAPFVLAPGTGKTLQFITDTSSITV